MLVGLLLLAAAAAGEGAPPENADPKSKEQAQAAKIKKLIEDLDSKNFEGRQAAERELEAPEERALPALDAALKTSSSLEATRRIESVRSQIRQTLLGRAVKQVLADVNKGGIDRFLDHMATRKELDTEACWKTAFNTIQALAERASKAGGRDITLPQLD